jgi:hypothetical protein
VSLKVSCAAQRKASRIVDRFVLKAPAQEPAGTAHYGAEQREGWWCFTAHVAVVEQMRASTLVFIISALITGESIEHCKQLVLPDGVVVVSAGHRQQPAAVYSMVATWPTPRL